MKLRPSFPPDPILTNSRHQALKQILLGEPPMNWFRRILLFLYPRVPAAVKLRILLVLYPNGPKEFEFRGDL